MLNYYLYALYSIVKLMSIGCVTKKYGHNEVLWETALVYFDKFLTASNARRARAKGFPHVCFPRRGKLPPSLPFGRQLPRWGSHGGVAPCPRPAVGEGLAPPMLRALPRRRKFKETLIKSRCSDLRQKFSLARKKSAGILCVFQTFLTKTSGDLCREDGRGDLFRGSLRIFNEATAWKTHCAICRYRK